MEETGREKEELLKESPRKELKKEMSHLTREVIYGGGRECISDVMT